MLPLLSLSKRHISSREFVSVCFVGQLVSINTKLVQLVLYTLALIVRKISLVVLFKDNTIPQLQCIILLDCSLTNIKASICWYFDLPFSDQ